VKKGEEVSGYACTSSTKGGEGEGVGDGLTIIFGHF